MGGCALFAAGSLLCAVSPNVETLAIARAIEAVGCGTTATLSGAIVKDSYEGGDLKLAMTLLQSLIIIGPVIAPFLGSFAIRFIGWRGIFWGLTVGGAITVALSCLMSETYDAAVNEGKNLKTSLATMLRDSKMLVSNKSFTSLALFIGVTGIPFFAFIAVSSYILLDDFQVGYLEYSFIYAGERYNEPENIIYSENGKLSPEETHQRITSLISGATYSDEQIKETMRQCYKETGYILDPHGACGYQALEDSLQPGEIGVFCETAHPAKFKEKVDDILGIDVAIPERLAAFMKGQKQSVPMTKNFEDFKKYLLSQ